MNEDLEAGAQSAAQLCPGNKSIIRQTVLDFLIGFTLTSTLVL